MLKKLLIGIIAFSLVGLLIKDLAFAKSPPTKASTKPPVPSEIKLNQQSLPQKGVLFFKHQEEVTISGKTLPSASIELFIYSEPLIKVLTKANEDGIWNYKIVPNLEPGLHRVEAQAIDPKTGEKSERKTIAKFIIEYPKEEVAKWSWSPLTYGLAGLALVLAGFLVFLIIKRKRTIA